MFEVEFTHRVAVQCWLKLFGGEHRHPNVDAAAHDGRRYTWQIHRFRVVNVKTGEVVYEQE